MHILSKVSSVRNLTAFLAVSLVLFSAEDGSAQSVSVQTVAQLLTELDRASPGSEIVLADGLYRLAGRRMIVDRAGTANSPIVVRAQNQNGAVIETNGGESAFQVEQPYWIFDGLHIKVTNGSVHGYKLQGNGQHITIRNGKIELDSPAEGGIKGAGGANAPQPDYALIENNEIWFTSPTRNNNCEGIDAVAVKGWIIRKNHIHDIQKSSQGFDGIGWGVFTKGNSQDTIIEENLIHDSFVSISLGGGGTGSQFFRDGDTRYEEQNGIIRNNIVMNSGDVAVYLNKASNARIYNNTFFNSFTTCGAGCSSIDVRFGGSSADIRNNILDKPINDRDGGQHTASTNLFLASPTDGSWFVDVSNRDFHLKANTPPIDAAETLALVTQDFYGVLRPQGSAFDIGAAEFEITVPPVLDAGLPEDSGTVIDSGMEDLGFPEQDAGTNMKDATSNPNDTGSSVQSDASPRTSVPRRVNEESSCSCSALKQGIASEFTWVFLGLLVAVCLRRSRLKKD